MPRHGACHYTDVGYTCLRGRAARAGAETRVERKRPTEPVLTCLVAGVVGFSAHSGHCRDLELTKRRHKHSVELLPVVASRHDRSVVEHEVASPNVPCALGRVPCAPYAVCRVPCASPTAST